VIIYQQLEMRSDITFLRQKHAELAEKFSILKMNLMIFRASVLSIQNFFANPKLRVDMMPVENSTTSLRKFGVKKVILGFCLVSIARKWGI